ncbi:MAG: 3-phosphoshikimate 1-carboxyvinyltransferase [Deltaproteobacteria bacterium]|nr:3-phosphoshikimate 1-carboxyvinyltransferase [Deltaproteobacteria bacterium]
MSAAPRRLGATGALRGVVELPGDKSISHRALLFNALATGTAELSGVLDAGDTRSTLRCLRALGVIIEERGPGRFRVQGRAGALQEPEDVLDCGNSGTTMRTLLGLLAGQPLHACLTGDASLRRRPMGRVTRPLRGLGAQIDGAGAGERAPLSIRGGVVHNRQIESDVASAQVKTALLLAGLQGEGRLRLSIPDSRDHSERMLRAMGVELEAVPGRLSLVGGQSLRAIDVVVPGDVSSATFWLVAASITPGSDLLLRGCGLNPSRCGALDLLRRMGADIDVLNAREVAGEPVGDLVVRSAPLRGVEVGGAEIPRLIDEIPVLAVAAAVAAGPTTFRDAAELRHKESDRVSSTLALLRTLGVAAAELPDGLVVPGGARLRGGEVDPRGDHRLALSAAVAACAAEGEIVITDPDVASVSYPSFWSDLAAVQGAADHPSAS